MVAFTIINIVGPSVVVPFFAIGHAPVVIELITLNL
jgi:hypothetical protein